MPGEPPSDLACTECGVMLKGPEIEGMATTGLAARLAGRRTDRRIKHFGSDQVVVAYECPDCGHLWPRYPEGHSRHADCRRMIAWIVTQRSHQQRGLRP